MNAWHLLDSGAGAASYNMALDEAMLLRSMSLGQPVLRFYGWTEPAASFGFFQKYQDVAQWTQLRPLVRRPTGGGLVPHLSDWTYSVAIPPADPWYSLRAAASYLRLHEWIQASFTALGVTTELAPVRIKEIPGQCFIGAERSDLLWHGRKIAGAAQRRTRDGLLIQGSIQRLPLPEGEGLGEGKRSIARSTWQRALCDAACGLFNIRWLPLEPEASLDNLARELALEKYSQSVYNERK